MHAQDHSPVDCHCYCLSRLQAWCRVQGRAWTHNPEIKIWAEIENQSDAWGTWVALSAKRPPPDFGSGLDLRVLSSSPVSSCELTAWSLLGIVSLPLSLPLPHEHSLWINKQTLKKKQKQTLKKKSWLDTSLTQTPWVVVFFFVIREKNEKQSWMSINWKPMKKNIWPTHTMKCWVSFKNDKNAHLLSSLVRKHSTAATPRWVQNPDPPHTGCVI